MKWWNVKNKEPSSRRAVNRTKVLRFFFIFIVILVKYFVHRYTVWRFGCLFELNIGVKGLRIDILIYFALCVQAIVVVDPKAFITNSKYHYFIIRIVWFKLKTYLSVEMFFFTFRLPKRRNPCCAGCLICSCTLFE